MPDSRSNSGGMVEEIRIMVERGTSVSLMGALDFIRQRELQETEYGRIMSAVSVTLLLKLYPGLQLQLPLMDPPLTHGYTRILRAAEQSVYLKPQPYTQDFLELTLPFLALLNEQNVGMPLDALPDLEKARAINSESVLAPYFISLCYERAGFLSQAEDYFRLTSSISSDCYPAILGLARVLNEQGRQEESVQLLSELVIRYPDNMAIKRQLALGYYLVEDWSHAEPAVAEILQRNSRDSQFILMRARIMIEQGQFLQAQAPLDLYGTMDPNNRLYLFLRARVQAEGYRNRDAALNYLRSILRTFPDDEEASIYAARLLLESTRTEDQREGRELLQQHLRLQNASLSVTALALLDAIHREAWEEASRYSAILLEQRRDPQDLLLAYQVELGLGNNAAALALAQELYQRSPGNDEAISGYVTALINTGNREEAARLIENRISFLPGGPVKSRYYYLRSRLLSNEAQVMADLRASLFEDPRNLDALIAMFEIYRRQHDDRRAVYYLRQALALAPDNPQLRRWELEYSSLLY